MRLGVLHLVVNFFFFSFLNMFNSDGNFLFLWHCTFLSAADSGARDTGKKLGVVYLKCCYICMCLCQVQRKFVKLRALNIFMW